MVVSSWNPPLWRWDQSHPAQRRQHSQFGWVSFTGQADQSLSSAYRILRPRHGPGHQRRNQYEHFLRLEVVHLVHKGWSWRKTKWTQLPDEALKRFFWFFLLDCWVTSDKRTWECPRGLVNLLLRGAFWDVVHHHVALHQALEKLFSSRWLPTKIAQRHYRFEVLNSTGPINALACKPPFNGDA